MKFMSKKCDRDGGSLRKEIFSYLIDIMVKGRRARES